jgi:chemotaxis response regulator CheB
MTISVAELKMSTEHNATPPPTSPRKKHARTHSQSAEEKMPRSTKTVVILGAAYGGARAARMLAQTLPSGWRLVVIDRNSHMNR